MDFRLHSYRGLDAVHPIRNKLDRRGCHPLSCFVKRWKDDDVRQS